MMIKEPFLGMIGSIFVLPDYLPICMGVWLYQTWRVEGGGVRKRE